MSVLFQYAQQEQLLRQQTRAVGVLVREKLFQKVRFPKISQGRTRKITTVFVSIRHLSWCLFDTKLKNRLKGYSRIEYITKMLDIIKTEKANKTLNSIFNDYIDYCVENDFTIGCDIPRFKISLKHKRWDSYKKSFLKCMNF